jgi:hypothetical protein
MASPAAQSSNSNPSKGGGEIQCHQALTYEVLLPLPTAQFGSAMQQPQKRHRRCPLLVECVRGYEDRLIWCRVGLSRHTRLQPLAPTMGTVPRDRGGQGRTASCDSVPYRD